MTAALDIRDLTVAYDDKVVLDQVSVSFPVGKLMAIVGPNGAGKSTLIKAALGLTEKMAGDVLIFGEPYRLGDLRVAYLPQRESVDWDFPVTVFDVVLMGTYGRLPWHRRPGATERAVAQAAIRDVGLEGLERRQISQLSGGQQQRVFLARALAQQAELLVMDEPFAGVDAATELAILDVLRQQIASGRTVVAVHHDLDTVRDRFDEVVALNRRVVYAGAITAGFTEEALRAAYGVGK